MLVTATLTTAAGEVVGSTQVPDFKPAAEILIWGQRFFRFESLTADGKLTYREGLAWWVVEPVTLPDGTTLPLFDEVPRD
jgi:hypothetical protein